MLHKNLNPTKVRVEGPVKTRKKLETLFSKPFDPEVLDGTFLDQHETARFIAEKVQVLRIAAIGGELRNLTWMIETAFYEAYARAQKTSRSVDFVNPSHGLQ